MQPRPNAKRADNAVLLLWACLAMNAISFVSNYFQYRLLNGFMNGEEISPVSASSNDLRQQIISIASLGVYIVSIVMFILWFRRAYYNLALKAGPLSQTDGWAAGGWFVPILAWFRPYQMMKEMYETTIGLLNSRNPDNNYGRSIPLIGWWWAAWVTGNIIDNFIFRYTRSADQVDEFVFITWVDMVSNIITIIGAVLAVRVVKNYASLEQPLAELADEPQEYTAAEERGEPDIQGVELQ
jgi:hypothetical protein